MFVTSYLLHVCYFTFIAYLFHIYYMFVTSYLLHVCYFIFITCLLLYIYYMFVTSYLLQYVEIHQLHFLMSKNYILATFTSYLSHVCCFIFITCLSLYIYYMFVTNLLYLQFTYLSIYLPIMQNTSAMRRRKQKCYKNIYLVLSWILNYYGNYIMMVRWQLSHVNLIM